MTQLCWIGAVPAAASLWAASAGGLVYVDAWAVTPALAQDGSGLWDHLGRAAARHRQDHQHGFGTVADLQATDPARAETVWWHRRRRRPSVR